MYLGHLIFSSIFQVHEVVFALNTVHYCFFVLFFLSFFYATLLI
jgi:hypothetical protein